ncbi:MAG TPA: D-2-hydroxyacid dehydrogenase [Streptosporangiaceae bacterium]|nr:D-2-hydroxyacid dehydrogenase [Streptosporangiaceae bacterium]
MELTAGSGAEWPIVAVLGAPAGAPPAELLERWAGYRVRFVATGSQLATEAAGAEVVYLWDRVAGLGQWWGGWSERVRWLAAPTAGVDWLLFPELVDGDVVVTNAAGVFDDAMAEYTLALVSAITVDLPGTLRLQGRREWRHRETRRLAGARAVILGAGGIGRAIHRALRGNGLSAQCVARQARADPEVGPIAALADLPGLLPGADFVILALPLTGATRGLIGPAELARMDPGGWLINVGRGALVDEPALLGALRSRAIGGAALDVFTAEPLPPTSPWWDLPNVIVSPHMSGDFLGWEQALTSLFTDQLRRWQTGRPLLNVVDKRLGFVVSG